MPAAAINARRPLKPVGALPPATMWVKSDAQVWQDTVGGTLAATDSQPAAAWSDQSGNGNHLLSGNAATYKTGQINGLPSVRFDGVADYLQNTMSGMAPPFDLFMMVKQIAWAGNVIVAGRSLNSFQVTQHSATPQLWIYSGGGFGGANSNLAVGAWGLVEAGVPYGSASYLKVNNTAATIGSTASGAGPGGLFIGCTGGPQAFCSMDVAEIILYTGVLSPSDAASVRAYFTGRYGIP